MRWGIWLPLWLWLILLPVIAAGFIVYAVVWLLVRGGMALVDAGDRRRERRAL
jgi:hypothetical protein